MELLTKDTHLDFFSDDGATWLELYGLESYPDMGAAPPKIKVTNMRDANERYIGGIPDVSDMKFGFFYNKEKDPDAGTMIKKNFAKLKELEEAGAKIKWKLNYPDNTSYAWEGKPTVYVNGGNVGEAMKYTLSVTLESKLEWNGGNT